jgi:hypothetical protein
MIIDLVRFDDLRDSFPRLFRTVSKVFGYTSGTYAVDLTKLSDFTRGELSAWIRTQREKKPPAPAPVVEPAAQPEPQPDMTEVLKEEQAARQKIADLTRAEQRLEQYAVEQGLERTHANAQAVADFIDASPAKGYWSREIIDAAIANRGPRGTNVLTWKPKEAPAPPPPAEPQEVLQDWQLPLDADERTMKNASVRALQDLIARRRKATNQMYVRKGHGASF